ncbi:hypothetical protein BAUCODRAFT_70754 [Baudoinia panamericana UAMH 10762]|uniref:Uncharacterized protein n=1 Tax=Baudoinia panamericana (strain UAMH 10762) TaxID=717646 RepID=M2LP88_BAUPA|nr:uncharacterized protein BAUCODRAFT_70754 [Baudoinia panamericana UAMH 10762]EMC96197.1 hypothetical protein BAUCODRAFT_70754 [Baudoinia panamericana UAMH 10762]
MHVCQAGLSAWGGYQSYIAITNLRKYEETTKKLAKWSNTVEEQLHKTRTTQGAGAVAILLSFIAATTLASVGARLNPWVRFGISPVMLLTVLFARGHIKNFWAPGDSKTVGTRIPLPNMEDYNEAQRRTEEVLGTLEYLEYGWVATTFIAGMLGYS